LFNCWIWNGLLKCQPHPSPSPQQVSCRTSIERC
jgi:hypothetical protein